jgi:hypothetical protein
MTTTRSCPALPEASGFGRHVREGGMTCLIQRLVKRPLTRATASSLLLLDLFRNLGVPRNQAREIIRSIHVHLAAREG